METEVNKEVNKEAEVRGSGRNWTKIVVVGVPYLFVFAVLIFIAIGFFHKAAVEPLPAMPAGNLPAPKAFLDEWKNFAVARDEFNADEKKSGMVEKRDRLTGWAERLQAQVPKNYRWDEPTKSFAPLDIQRQVSPAPQPPPAAATPTQAPAK